MIKDIFVADLTHTARGLGSNMFPLGAAYVAAYAKKKFGDKYNIKVFKLPEKLAEEVVKSDNLSIIACSCYAWNTQISYELCKWAKEIKPNIIIVFGGPNFPYGYDDKIKFLNEYPIIDFYIQGEGEEGFVDLIQHLENNNFNARQLKSKKEMIINCNYLDKNGNLLNSDIERISDLNDLESPYLSGMLDEFFGYDLIPLLETNRGCPFTCTYCADGAKIKCKITKHPMNRIKNEIKYIHNKIKHVSTLFIVDTNFGMYDEDICTARIIAKSQQEYCWPSFVDASPGKNRKDKIKKVIEILNGTIAVGASIQTSDKEVLKNIRRENINLDACKEYISFARTAYPSALSFTDIILGLPGDTMEKHFNSILYSLEMGVSNIKTYQAMLLLGSELELNDTREKFKIKTRYRVIPGCIGEYHFGNKIIRIMELEEIIVETDTLSTQDYINSRVFDLLLDVYYNGCICEEIFKILTPLKIFENLKYIYEHMDLFPKTIQELIVKFKKKTADDIYLSKEVAYNHIFKDEIFKLYEDGTFGTNELITYKYLLHHEFEDLIKILIQVLKLNTNIDKDYLDDLGRFVIYRKKNFYEILEPFVKNFSYDIDNKLKQDVMYRFYHTPEQIDYINSNLKAWEKSSRGIAGMIQKSNTKPMFRSYEVIK